MISRRDLAMVLNNRAFTLMEVLITIMILGIIATFGGVSYIKTVDKTAERDAVNQMMTIHSAQKTYFQAMSGYYPGAGNNVGIDDINTNLGLNILPNTRYNIYCQETYECFYGRMPKPGSLTWTARLNQNAIDPATNPCCASGTCPTLPAC